jgi:hypothetical protein
MCSGCQIHVLGLIPLKVGSLQTQHLPLVSILRAWGKRDSQLNPPAALTGMLKGSPQRSVVQSTRSRRGRNASDG